MKLSDHLPPVVIPDIAKALQRGSYTGTGILLTSAGDMETSIHSTVVTSHAAGAWSLLGCLFEIRIMSQ